MKLEVDFDETLSSTSLAELTAAPLSQRFYTPDSNSNSTHYKRDERIIEQTNQLPELFVISQPEGIPLSQLTSFNYQSTAGRDITVYIIDSGANPNNLVSALSNSLKG
jgi:hypothetical protein